MQVLKLRVNRTQDVVRIDRTLQAHAESWAGPRPGGTHPATSRILFPVGGPIPNGSVRIAIDIIDYVRRLRLYYLWHSRAG